MLIKLNPIIDLLKKYLSGQISADNFAVEYFEYWRNEVREKESLVPFNKMDINSQKAVDILSGTFFSDVDMVTDDQELLKEDEFSTSTEELRPIAENVLKQLQKLI